MKMMRLMGSVSAACGLTLAMTAPALASDVSVDNTGADSTQSVVIDSSSEVSTTNTNVIQIVNENVQSATSGNVSAEKNTNVGGLSSGVASNVNTTTTLVTIDNQADGCCGLGSDNGNNLPGNGNESSNTASHPAGGQSGNVLGSSTGGQGSGVALLPVTGPSGSVDVSAIRAAFQPQSQAVNPILVKSRNLSGMVLIAAALLSLVGAFGSAVYATRRKEGRV